MLFSTIILICGTIWTCPSVNHFSTPSTRGRVYVTVICWYWQDTSVCVRRSCLERLLTLVLYVYISRGVSLALNFWEFCFLYYVLSYLIFTSNVCECILFFLPTASLRPVWLCLFICLAIRGLCQITGQVIVVLASRAEETWPFCIPSAGVFFLYLISGC